MIIELDYTKELKRYAKETIESLKRANYSKEEAMDKRYDTTEHVLYYASGRFPEMTVSDFISAINQIKDETEYFRTIVSEVYDN